jgi:hypothetical protein
VKKIQFFLYLTFTIMIAACDNNSGGGDPMPELPKLSIGDVTRFEGNENLYYSFIVTASASFSKEIKVDYCTEEITAGEGTDFINTSGTITLPAGERNASIEVEIVADTLKEIDEQFKVILSNPVNAVLVDTEGLGTIRNDDTFIDIPEDGYITPDNHLGYHLVWQDEFNDAALNEADWTYEIWPPGQVNNELQTYTDREENLYFSDGNLVIEAKKESHAGAAYTSARIITQNKQFFQWGRVDIRAILPEGQGIWPALWMLGTNIEDVGWPACGEIDIMELVGHEPSTTHGTAHWGPQGQSYSIYRGQGYSLSDGKIFGRVPCFFNYLGSGYYKVVCG